MLGKLVFIAGLLLALAWDGLRGMLDAFQRSPQALLGLIAQVTRALFLRALFGFILLGALDYLYQRMQLRRRLRMSHRELAEEHRESEGDPQIIRERRRRQQQVRAEATLAELSRASLVVHGPADRAVALRFDAATDTVPVLWLKADGKLAERLVGEALSSDLPVHEDAELATQLYRLELTEAIPPAFYQRVAELMALHTKSGSSLAQAQS